MEQSKISDLKHTIRAICTMAKQGIYVPLMVWGAPGVGKSAGVKQVTDELGIGFIDLRLSLLNPVDLRGMPTIDKERHKAIWLESDFLPNGKHEKEGILFLDEINLAPQSVMSAGYQLILDRKLGEYEMPKGWIIVAAGNRSEDNSATTRFPSPLANRFVHMEIGNPDLDDWRAWAMKNGIHEHIVTFLSRMPQHLYAFPKNQEKTFPSPRSWAFASDLHTIGLSINGAVGDGAASEFYAFIKVFDKMPDVDKILKGEEKTVPKQLDVMWATLISLVYRCEKETVEAFFSYVTQKELGKEFQALAVVLLTAKSEELMTVVANSKGYETWALLPENQVIFDVAS